MPQEFACQVVDYDDADGPPEPVVEVTWQVVDGSPVCREVVFRALDSDREVQRSMLAETSLEVLLDQTVKAMLWNRDVRDKAEEPISPFSGNDWEAAKRGAVREFQHARANRRVVLDDETLRTVAEVYRANVNGNPTQAVADYFGKHPRTARLYVKRARQAQFLGGAVRGKAGEQ